MKGTIRTHAYAAGCSALLLIATLALPGCGTPQTDFPDQGFLPAPTGLHAENSSSGIRLSWDPVAGASFYQIYWARGATVSRTTGTALRSFATTFLQSGLRGGETYAYLVAAVDSKGHEGEPSAVVTTTLGPTPRDAPQNVRATAGDAEVTIDWDPVPNASSYRVEVASALASFTVTNHPAPPFVHRRALNRTTYTYTVRASFGGELGPASLPVAATPMPTRPGFPIVTDVQVRTVVAFDSNGGTARHGAISLRWTPADHATDYQVYAKRDQGPEVALIPAEHPLKVTAFTHEPVDYETAYEYRIEAFNDGVPSGMPDPPGPPIRASVPRPLENGTPYYYVLEMVETSQSATSNEASAVPLENILLVPPTNVKVIDTPHDGGGSLTITWKPSTTRGVTGQQIFRSDTGDPGSYVLLKTIDGSATASFVDEPVSDGTQYFYKLNALARDLESDLSTAASGIAVSNSALVPPTNLSVIDTPGDAGDSLTITWVPSTANGVTNQQLHRSTTDGGPYDAATVIMDSRDLSLDRFIDGNLLTGVTYYYVVRALIGDQDSAISDQAAGTPVDNGEPFPPRSLQAGDVPADLGGSIALSWIPSVSSTATSQRLYRATSSGGPYDLVAVFTDMSAASYTDSAVSGIPPPTGLEVTQDGGDLVITWSPVAAASDGYRLFWWEENSSGQTVPIKTEEDIVTERFVHRNLTPGSHYVYAVQVQGFPAVSATAAADAP